MKYKGITSRNLGEIWEKHDDGYYRCPTRHTQKRLSEEQMQQGVERRYFEPVWSPVVGEIVKRALDDKAVVENITELDPSPQLSMEEFEKKFFEAPVELKQEGIPFLIEEEIKDQFANVPNWYNEIKVTTPLWARIWFLITNPFTYLFKGKIRF